MAIIDGKFTKGTAGGMANLKAPGKQVVQDKPAQMHQTKATIKSAKEFGKGSRLAKNIRLKLGPMYYNGNDGDMVSRLTKDVNTILRNCYDPNTKSYQFSPQSFQRLEGFNFNIYSPLQNSLLVRPEISLENNVMMASLPEIQVPAQLKLPVECSIAVLQAWGAAVALKDGYIKMLKEKKQEVLNMQGHLDPISWTFDIPKGCLGIIGYTICYYKSSSDFMILMNSKQFWPAAICGAIYNPGIFNMDNLKSWQNMGINFSQ